MASFLEGFHAPVEILQFCIEPRICRGFRLFRGYFMFLELCYFGLQSRDGGLLETFYLVLQSLYCFFIYWHPYLLDLDTGAVRRVLREPNTNVLTGLDIGWDNDGGGALMKNPSGSARILALPDAKDFEDAAGKTLSRVSLVRNSDERGNVASQCRFFAVLTDRDNLAVVGVTDYSEMQATIRWRFLLGPNVRRTGTATVVR